MRKVRLRRPSPALVVSLVALIIAMGGTSYAAFKIGTKNIKNGAVTTAKLHNGAVTNKKIANGAITGSKVNLGTLGTVPNANHANSAGNATTVGGQTVQKFFYSSGAPTTSLTTVAQIGPFTLKARCNGAGADLELTSSVGNWDLGGTHTDTGGANSALYGFSISTGTSRDLAASGSNNGGYATAVTPDGHVVSITFQDDGGPTLAGAQCDEAGTMTGS